MMNLFENLQLMKEQQNNFKSRDELINEAITFSNKADSLGIYQDRLGSAKVKLDKAKSEVTKFQEECDNIQSKIDFITTLRDKVKALFSGANFTISSMRINDIGNIIYLDIDDISVLDSLVKLSKATEVKVKGKEFKEFEGTIKGVKIKMFEADGYLVIKIENYKKSLGLK